MKVALNFNKQSKYLDKADDIIIKWHETTGLIDFLQEHKDQRVVISVEDIVDFYNSKGIDTLSALKEKNFVIRFPFERRESAEVDKCVDLALEKKIPFFYNSYCDRWEVLYSWIEDGITDVYIVNQLGFELDRVADVCHKYNISVRIFPNITQSCWEDEPVMTKFWVRPEDLDAYGEYADICEFFQDINMDTNEQLRIQNTLYEIYFIDKHWYGNLAECILGLDFEIDSRFLHPNWIHRRIKCGKSCLKNDTCSMCMTLVDLEKSLKAAGLLVSQKPEEEKDINERAEDLGIILDNAKDKIVQPDKKIILT